MDLNKIICADSLQVMKEIPDKEIDLVLTDPPYGLGRNNHENNKSRVKLADPTDWGQVLWDENIPDKRYFDEIFRISKNQIIFGGNYFTEYLPSRSCWLVWDKDNSGDFADCELIWTSFKSATRKIKWRWNGMLQEDPIHKEKRYHPTQKPIGLIKWVLEKYSERGDIICDPFCGSGSIPIACLKTERRFIGIEKEPIYYEISLKRLKPWYEQKRLVQV
jgi:site-specific DNA-methyltransferase (adenine-specific)